MSEFTDNLDLESLLELKLDPHSVGEFCEGILDAEMLVEDIDMDVPSALGGRKQLCKFLGIGESTLTGWLKARRIPRAAKVACVLLVGMAVLQLEIKRLRQEAQDLKLVRDGETYQLVLFDTDDAGMTIGRIVARNIVDPKIARVTAGSAKAFRTLQETRDVIAEMLERTDNPDYIQALEDLDYRIVKDTLSAFDPEKWRELFETPFDLEDFVVGSNRETTETVVIDTSLGGSAASIGKDGGGPGKDKEA